jgi:DNA polymerase-3 subunit alpha
MTQFVHLHNHSDYSLLDGAQKVEQLVARVHELGMPAVALTEHGNLFSAIHFYKTARKYGIKPIIGCEVYVTDNHLEKKAKAQGGAYHHFLLLAQDLQGYRNLIKLVSLSYLEGFYYRPRIDCELMRKYNQGLIAATACIKGKVQELALKGDYEKARATALELAEIFPDRFYLEVQNHGLKEENSWREIAKQISADTGIPRVATNDTHYACQNHWEAHDAHFCLGIGKELKDPDRLHYEPSEYWIKNQAEMEALFQDDPEALANTLRIAEQCHLELDFSTYHLPEFSVPENIAEQNPDNYLRELVFAGLKQRYQGITPEIQARADYELDVIRQMNFAGYFLIVQDFVGFAKDRGIPVGPGRGSAAGSIVCYALRITDIDPLRFNLLFERFLNPERVTMPDIDIDFCDEKRNQVIDYIKKKYGSHSVSQIITFGKMKARAVIRDVGRVLSMPLPEVDRIAKMVPEGPKVDLETALAQNKELREVAELDAEHRKLFAISLVLEGMNRHSSTHAAGVVIAPGDLTDYVPLYRSSNGDITTQFDMKSIEDIGLLKVDFLGLRNLTVIDDTLKMLKKQNVQLTLDQLPDKDEKTLAIFGEGLTIGIFQFESAGMRDYLKKLKPSGIEDLIAMNALYRPGPMEWIDDFIARKHGRTKIGYLHPLLKDILEETYGIIVYQEQVMQIASKLAGFNLGEADLLRRAMGKKDPVLMQQQRAAFVKGVKANTIDEHTANQIFDLMDRFAGYGFNKSHATCYSIVAYQTAYLKAHYPLEFLAANLTSEMNNTSRVVILANEVRNMGTEILPPDINRSEVHFVPDKGGIRYGLHAIKNVGERAAESIVAARKNTGPFKTFFELVAALNLKNINRKALECLVASGACDSLEGTRAQKFEAADLAIQYSQKLQEERENRQASLFGLGSENGSAIIAEPQLSNVPPWSDSQRWAKEKELLGMYMTGHPLLKYAKEIENFSNYDFTEPLAAFNQSTIKLGGLISEVKRKFDRKDRQFAFFTLESLSGTVEVLAFADVFSEFREIIETDRAVFVQGRVSTRGEDDAKIIAESIQPLAGLMDRITKQVNVRIQVVEAQDYDFENLKNQSLHYPGDCQLVFHLIDENGNRRVIRSESVKVQPNKAFLDQLVAMHGEENVWIEG